MNKKGHIKSSSYNKGIFEQKFLLKSQNTLSSIEREKQSLAKILEKYHSLLEEFPKKETQHFYTTHSPSIVNNFYYQCDNVVIDHESLLSKYNYYLKSNTLSESFFSLDFPIHTSASSKRARDINEELRILKQKAKQAPSAGLFLKIKKLVQELHSLVTDIFRTQKNIVKNIVKAIHAITSDLRLLFRRRSRSLFKYFDDFSGSEEDAAIQIILNRNIFLEYKTEISCITKKKLLNQSIYI